MILHMHGKSLVIGIKRRAFRDSPRFQHAVHFKAEVVMQAGSVVALHDESVLRFFLDFRRRFGRFFEAPFSFVLVEGHGLIL